VQRWLNAKRDDKLVYQAFKYNQRSKFSWADFLELTRPKPGSESKSEIFRYLTRTAKWAERKREDKEVPTSLAPYIAARDVKAPADAVLADVVSGKVSWEMVASEKRDKKFWEAILQKLPMTALVRNLANLTRYDVLTNGDFERLSWLRTRLTDTEAIQKARLHPLQFLAALLRYQTGRGQEGRRGKAHTWSPITQVNDILEEGIDKAFVTVPETDTATLVGVDISGSMQGSWSAPVMGIPGFSAAMAAGLMAQQFIRRAPNSTVFGYDQQVYKLGLSPKDSYSTTVRKVSLGGGLTNTSLPILAAHQLHAQNKRVKYETIVIITDNEINRGTVHPVQALEAYRRLVGLPVRLVIMAVTATNFSVADPKDPHQLDVPGLDNTTPKVVHDFARGEI
jgi:60 kDa SS-A/Ro ribonucleoprotein